MLLNGGTSHSNTASPTAHVPLADACVTEWRFRKVLRNIDPEAVSLVDACVTEWRQHTTLQRFNPHLCHSLMPVLLNGGLMPCILGTPPVVPLADACDTEWRLYVLKENTDHISATR